jgi:hypothetical protein
VSENDKSEITFTGSMEVNGPASNYYQDAANMTYDSFRRTIFFGPTTTGFRLDQCWNWHGLDWIFQGQGFRPLFDTERLTKL